MKKTISILLIVAMMLASMLAIIPASADAPAGEAIKSATDFANMKADGEYYLANDIQINASYKEFKGKLDGNGNTVIVKGANPMFETIKGGTVKNLNVSMVFEAEKPNGDFGALARTAYGTFTNINVNVEANFTGKATTNFIGGVFGKINGETNINAVVASGFVKQSGETLEGNDYCTNAAGGGLVGATDTDKQVLIENSTNRVDVYTNVTRAPAAGIVGASNANTKLVIKTTQNYAKIDVYANGKKADNSGNMGSHSGVAGFVGIVNANGKPNASVEIYNSRNYGEITRHGSGDINMMTGGFLGRVYGGSKIIVDGCVNSGEIKPTGTGSWASTGGIIGNIETYNFSWSNNKTAELTVRNSVNTGKVGNSDYKGGIVGSIIQSCSPAVVLTIENCANYGEVASNGGGILGTQGAQAAANKLVIKNCYNAGATTTGIVHSIRQEWHDSAVDKDIIAVPYPLPEITNCVNEGNVTNGIIGTYTYAENDLSPAGRKAIVTNCVSTYGSAPNADQCAVTAPEDEDATVAAVKAAIAGNPAELDAVLAEYAGFVGEDYASGWDVFEPIFKAALADANKATAQATLDAHIDAVIEAAQELVLADITPLIPALEDIIETANAKLAEAGDGSAYTPNTWESFNLALASAQEVYDEATGVDAEVKPSLVINATDKIAKALAALALIPTEQKAALGEDIATYEAYDQSKYVSATWTVLVDTIAAVKVIKDDINSTASDIEAAAASLSAAVNALALKADPASLGAKANQAIKDYPAAPYTAKSYNELRTLVNDINKVVTENDISQAGIDELSAALEEAISKLVKKGNFDAIDALIEPFGEIVIEGARPQVDEDIVETLKDKYTRDTLKEFTIVLELVAQAKKQDNIPNFTEADAAELEAALQAAIDGLIPFADYTAIDAKIAEVAALDKTKYTEDSWKAVQNAINVTALLKSDRNAVQEQADAALAALNAAIAGLTEVSADDGEGEKKGCKSAIGATVVVMTATLALGATTLLKKKED